MSKQPSPAFGIVVGLAAAFAVWAVLWLSTARTDSQLERACKALIEGADLEEIVVELGREGYRPGCSLESSPEGAPRDPGGGLPCTTVTVGSLVDFPYLCEGADCSLYWRINDVACLVELDAAALTLESAAFMTLGARAAGVE
ncbi:MAG: hypothetical protein KDA24_01665 [Deltaproteobacteria bacterium]|nr:hypothetical protein [Deltaproteobacteria bacterium]